MKVAITTGASRGLGVALARGLAEHGWALVLDARGSDALAGAAGDLADRTTVRAVPGDITDGAHRRALAAPALGPCDTRIYPGVNNSSFPGPSPQPARGCNPLAALRQGNAANALPPRARLRGALATGR